MLPVMLPSRKTAAAAAAAAAATTATSAVNTEMHQRVSE
jgi:hypothetical protein